MNDQSMPTNCIYFIEPSLSSLIVKSLILKNISAYSLPLNRLRFVAQRHRNSNRAPSTIYYQSKAFSKAYLMTEVVAPTE